MRSSLAACVAAAIVVGITAIAIPVLNLVVDPYRAFGTPEITGFNDVKPEVAGRVRLSKAFSTCWLQPDLVFMGGSRAEFLYSPRHKEVTRISERPYNLALAGSNIWETALMLRHAYFSSGHLKTAVVGIDLVQFNAYREKTSMKREIVDFDLDRLVLSPRQSCLSSYLRDLPYLLFSMPAVESSFKTLAESNSPEQYRRNGMRHLYHNLLSSTLRTRMIQRDGLIGHVRAYVDLVWFPAPDRRFCFETDDGTISSFAAVQDMIDFAREHGIKLVFVIQPEHAILLLGERQAGLAPMIELWKRRLTAMLSRDAARHPGAGFPLYDFSQINAITGEYAWPGNPNYRMNYWLESSHATQTTGNLLLDTVLGGKKNGFGVKLAPGNVEQHLRKVWENLDRYASNHPIDLKDVDDTLAKFPFIREAPPCELPAEADVAKAPGAGPG